MLEIEQQRRFELFSEWSHRWLDLKRTGRADVVLGGSKSGWQSTDALFPIPQQEIDRNRQLTQNQGY
jgi:starch-binding outer membrane protein, SusD/RagB family